MNRLLIFWMAITLTTNSPAYMSALGGAYHRYYLLNSGQSGIASKTFKAMCHPPSGIPFCIMAGLSAAQSVADLFGAKGSGDTRDIASCQNSINCVPSGGGSYNYDANGEMQINRGGALGTVPVPNAKLKPKSNLTSAQIAALNEIERDVKNTLAELAGKGFTVDTKSGVIQTPNGSISMKKLSTPEGLASAGFTAKDLEQIKNISEQAAQKAIQKYGNIFKEDADESAAAGRSAGAESDQSERDLQHYVARMMAGEKPQKESLAGLAIIRNGEPVGISQSNIFETITRRYNTLKQDGEFK